MNTAAGKSAFVDGLALLSLACAALGAASCLLQFAPLPGPRLDTTGLMRQVTQLGLQWPADLHWVFDHARLLNAISLVASLLTAGASWGLWKRREWGRIGFIAVLLASAASCVAGTAWSLHLVDAMLTVNADGTTLHDVRQSMHAVAWIGTALIVLLHLGIVRTLCTRTIRAEFEH